VSFYWSDGYIIPRKEGGSDTVSVPLRGSGQFVRWTGYLVAPRTDDFKIFVRSTNANTTVHIDSQLVFDNIRAVKKSVSMVQDATYKIVVHARVESSIAAENEVFAPPVGVQLVWSTVTIKEYEIPSFFMYPEAQPVQLSPFPVNVSSALARR
jgi:hypothetical protein